MLAVFSNALGKILYFWSPSFEDHHRNESILNRESCTDAPPPNPNRKKVKGCKIMKSLQKTLSEAQKRGVDLQPILQLIKIHKQFCPKCRQRGS